MSSRERRPSPGPAEPELPPTLQPEAVLSAAPRSSRFLSGSLALVAYLACAGATVVLARVTPEKRVHIVTVRGGDDPDDYQPPPPPIVSPVPPPPVLSKAVVAPAGRQDDVKELPPDSNVVPETPHDLPTQDLSERGFRRPEGPSGPAGPGVPIGPSVVPPVTQAVQVMAPVEMVFSQMRVLQQEPVSYPPLAARARVEGSVELYLTVNEQGQPVQVAVLSGHPMLQGEAVRSANLWRFEPARMNGQAVPARFRLTIVFRLRK